MEENKKTKGSSSSFTSDLFGSNENSATNSSDIFGSIFPPPNKESRRESLRSEEIEKKQASVNHGTSSRSNEGNIESNETSPYYHEQRVQQPCHLSSSIYYGGQDIYSRPQPAQPGMVSQPAQPGMNQIKRDEGEDDSGSVSRGNWWKGSLYY